MSDTDKDNETETIASEELIQEQENNLSLEGNSGIMKEQETSENDNESDKQPREQVQEQMEEDNESIVSTSKPVLCAEEGPFSISSVIKDLPPDLQFTCCESYTEHVYMGTATGELLHYFEIETGNYLLVSRIQFDDSFKPIDKILLFTSLERACVLSHGELALFLLPEFAPSPNSKKLSGIKEIQPIGTNKIMTFTEQKSSIYKLSKIESFKKLRDFPDLKCVSKALISHKKLIVAKNNNYEIFDLLKNKEIPLFKVSEGNNLNPIITEFGNNEILVCSGGSSYDDEAMALVITLDGDISQGTIALSKYPRNIIVEFPYVLVNFNYNQIQIFKLIKNEDPLLMQTINYPEEALKDIYLQFNKVAHIFQNHGNNGNDNAVTEQNNLIIDKLRSVPIISEELGKEEDDNRPSMSSTTTTLDYRIDRERAFIKEVLNCDTNIVLYDNNAVYELSQRPFCMEIKEYNESEISNIEDFLDSLNDIKLTSFQKIEIRYLKLLRNLLILLHCDKIDKDMIRKWCHDMKSIDIRILLYLLDLKIYGECWCPNGLKKFVSNLKSLKLINKLPSKDTLLDFLNIIKRYIVKNHSNDKDFIHFETILRTLDVNIFSELVNLKRNIDTINVDEFEYTSLDEIVNVIQARKLLEYEPLLIDIYMRKEMLDEIIDIFRSQNNYPKLLQFLIDHEDKLNNNYVKDKLIEDIVTIIKNSKYEKDKIIKRVLTLLAGIKFDYHKLLDKLNDDNDISLKVDILEIIGVDNSQDKQFLIDYYTQKLEECLIKDKLWDKLDGMMEEYCLDVNYFKVNVLDFLKLKVKYDSDFSRFNEHYKSIMNICKEDDSLRKLLHDNIMKMNKIREENHPILLILFFYKKKKDSKKLQCSYLDGEELLQTFLRYRDYQSIELDLTERNFINVLKWYGDICHKSNSSELIVKFLLRNGKYWEDDLEMILKIFRDIIPGGSRLSTISQILITVITQRQIKQTDTNIHKMILKSEVNRYGEVIDALRDKS